MNNPASTPVVAQDVVRAFNYCLREQTISPEQAMDMAQLMLELASLHQYLAIQDAQPLDPAATAHLAECRRRVDELSALLGVQVANA